MKHPFLVILCLIITTYTLAQTNPNIGIKDERHTAVAFTNATIHINSTTTLTKGTLLIKDEKIVDCGEKISIPKEAKTIDCSGKHIYASFIETWSSYGLNEDKSEKNGAYYWNDNIKSDFCAYQFYSHNKEGAEK